MSVRKTLIKNKKWIGVGIIIILVIIGLYFYMIQPKTMWTTVTVFQKNSVSTLDVPHIVAQDGGIYQFQDTTLWEKLKVGETYQIRWRYITNPRGKLVDGVTVDGVTYTESVLTKG